MGRICGVDFDNTLVSYDKLLIAVARERGLIRSDVLETKRNLRDHIRQLQDGEVEWQKCQALLYGPRIREATLIDGVAEFFKLCRENGVKIYIVSHKTEFARYDTTRTNLRTAALHWMASNGFFDRHRLGLTASDVFFAQTRREKIERIVALGCTDFVDDLEETFLEDTFPPNITRILYEPGRLSLPPPGVLWMRTWREISEYFCGTSR